MKACSVPLVVSRNLTATSAFRGHLIAPVSIAIGLALAVLTLAGYAARGPCNRNHRASSATGMSTSIVYPYRARSKPTSILRTDPRSPSRSPSHRGSSFFIQSGIAGNRTRSRVRRTKRHLRSARERATTHASRKPRELPYVHLHLEFSFLDSARHRELQPLYQRLVPIGHEDGDHHGQEEVIGAIGHGDYHGTKQRGPSNEDPICAIAFGGRPGRDRSAGSRPAGSHGRHR